MRVGNVGRTPSPSESSHSRGGSTLPSRLAKNGSLVATGSTSSPPARSGSRSDKQKGATDAVRRNKRDLDTVYLRKVDNCDRRIKRLEEELQTLAVEEQKAHERRTALLMEQQGRGSPSAMSRNGRHSAASAGSFSADGTFGIGSSRLGHGGRSEDPAPLKLSKEAEEKLIQRLTYPREEPDINAVFPRIENTRPARQMWERLQPNKETDDSNEDEVDVEGMVERLAVQDVETRATKIADKIEECEENGVRSLWRESVKQMSVARRRRVEEDFDEDAMDDEEEEELFVLSEERMETLGNRLCNESLEHKKRVLEELEQKYYGPEVNKSPELERSRLKRRKDGSSPDDNAEGVSPKELGLRLHDESMAKKKATLAMLESKYIAPLNVVRDGKTGELKTLPRLTRKREDDLVSRLAARK